jgi:hypothetical protein
MSVQNGPFTAINNNTHQQWQLKPNYSFHMYISQSPCNVSQYYRQVKYTE